MKHEANGHTIMKAYDAHVIFMWFELFFIRIKNVYMRNTKQV